MDSPSLQTRVMQEHKTDYAPKDKEAEYLAQLRSQFSLDWKNHQLESNFFWRKGLDDYMERNEADSYLLPWVTRKDSWRNNTRRQTIAEKIDAVVAAVADLNLTPELNSYDLYGEEVKEAAEALEVCLQYADGQNLTDLKDKFSVRYLLVHGTIAEDVSWMSMMRNAKSSRLDFETGEVKQGKEMMKPDFERIWSQVHPLNRVVLADRTQPIISLQPHIWKLNVMPYESAEAIFSKWPNWKHVKPIYGTPSDEWTSLVTQQQTEETGDARIVRMVTMEDRWRNEFAVILNGVLMTKPGSPMPGNSDLKDYSVTWTQLFPPSPHWAYGTSFVQRLRNDAVLLDFFYNALVDKQRQGLEPPIVSNYRTIMNRNMFRPGNASQGDINFKRLIDHNGITSADLQMVQFIEENLNKASTPPIMSGQQGNVPQTAFEVREQMRNALRAMYGVFSSVSEMKRQRAEAELRLILEHYPKLGVGKIKSKVSDAVGGIKQVFTAKGEIDKNATGGTKSVSFASLKDVNAPKALEAMEAAEDLAKSQGNPMKQIVVDPNAISEMRHVVQVVINPADRKSKKADKQELIDEYRMYVGNPAIDQQWAAKILLTGHGRDPEEALAKAPAPQEASGAMEMPQVASEPTSQIPTQPGRVNPAEMASVSSVENPI